MSPCEWEDIKSSRGFFVNGQRRHSPQVNEHPRDAHRCVEADDAVRYHESDADALADGRDFEHRHDATLDFAAEHNLKPQKWNAKDE
jgi:hypothetical protein